MSKTALRSKIAQSLSLRHWLGFFVDRVDGVDTVDIINLLAAVCSSSFSLRTFRAFSVSANFLLFWGERFSVNQRFCVASTRLRLGGDFTPGSASLHLG
ncbi:MAG TPA: hypothetical protein PKY10_01895, partial [Lentisphaeria bacterium]|nr:hypothetical protein [Lentisphaeria bacterium]